MGRRMTRDSVRGMPVASPYPELATRPLGEVGTVVPHPILAAGGCGRLGVAPTDRFDPPRWLMQEIRMLVCSQRAETRGSVWPTPALLLN